MKKTFTLTHPKIKYPRLIDSVRSEIRKYLKRERKKTLPEGVDFWAFDCKFGPTEADAKVVHVGDMNKCIDSAEAESLESFYIEILVKSANRTKLPESEKKVDADKPAEDTDKSPEGSDQPVEDSDKPAEDTDKPAEDAGKPSDAAVEG